MAPGFSSGRRLFGKGGNVLLWPPMRNDRHGIDDKSSVRGGLDLSSASWRRLPGSSGDCGNESGGPVEYAFVTHGNATYAVLRQSLESDGTVLVFTPSEWDAFLLGVRDGEFDRPR